MGDLAEPAHPRVASGERAEAPQLGAVAGDEQLDRVGDEAHRLDEQVEALRRLDPARGEEVGVATAARPAEVGRRVGDLDRRARREVAGPGGDGARDRQVTADALEGDAVEEVHHLAGEGTGERERGVIGTPPLHGVGEPGHQLERRRPAAAAAHQPLQPAELGVAEVDALRQPGEVIGVVQAAQPVEHPDGVVRVRDHPRRVLAGHHHVEVAEVEAGEVGIAGDEAAEGVLAHRQLDELGDVAAGLVERVDEPVPHPLGAARGEGDGARGDDRDPHRALTRPLAGGLIRRAAPRRP